MNLRILGYLDHARVFTIIPRLAHRGISAKDGKVDDCLAIASLILRSKTQCGSSHAVKLLENLDMFTHFFAASRHLGFEDIQAMIDLIGDARQISGLPTSLILDDCFISDTCNLVSICIPACNPLESSNPRIQSVVAQVVCAGDERPAFTGNEVLFNSFPVQHQRLTHSRSLYAPSCNSQGIPDSRIHRIATTRS